jgi:hypothetical protein
LAGRTYGVPSPDEYSQSQYAELRRYVVTSVRRRAATRPASVLGVLTGPGRSGMIIAIVATVDPR